MNQKLAKKLRSVAREMAGEKMESAYIERDNFKQKIVQNAEGKLEVVQEKVQGTIALHADCYRAIYRGMKKLAKGRK